MTPTPPLTTVLPIGYVTLRDLAVLLDATAPVYVTPYVETTPGNVTGQRTDHHFVLVTQPDTHNRVYYCRIPVVRLVYHNGIAFAPDYADQLVQVEGMRERVAAWLVEAGYTVQAGMVGLPAGYALLEGRFE